MIIVVEGINGVGKTRFCERLHDKTGIPVYRELIDVSLWRYKHGEEIREIMVEKMCSILEILRITESDIIFDTFHLTEWVYGWMDRDATTRSGIRGIDHLLKEMGAKIILMHPIDIDQINKEYGRDLTEHENMFSRCKSKCDIINCTYLETEAISVRMSEELQLEIMRKFECETWDEKCREI